MIDLYLNDDGDLTLDSNQELQTVTGGSEVAQAAAILLRTHKGEYFLDQDFGIDYMGQVLTKPFRKASAERHIRAELMKIAGLQAVLDISITPDYENRRLLGYIEIQSIYGTETIEL